ncbi:HlyD family efflux transporter periplasmic adaptor subunit [Oculatella sp. LEGE 06141]|uniref:HlyD family efflux transporter periplasmic adaptor subunit n=1 Tax=Oculatella sp. LEGE 06141 TaxID=1828648 RepID=UPI00187FDA00|nr:HlyD family efflux transporter periplasmic adaptor subunit [Oculatella sp. LEGE 06141]MBE9180578.1 HlyD family efflux transporter periplasmic adaptor subunit [Oculatella sp. LEGE 06141]
MKLTSARNGRNGAAKKPAPLAPVDGSGQIETTAEPSSASKIVRNEVFDQPVVLQQTSLWSRAIVWGIVGVASFVVVWASVAQIEEAIPATGKLEPQGSVQEVQAPVGGVVQQIMVRDGERVRKGDVLIRFDPRATEAQQRSLEQIRTSLVQENQFYRSQLSGSAVDQESIRQLNLPPEMLSLTASRAALVAENSMYRAQLNGSTAGIPLTLEQRQRFESGMLASSSQIAAAELEVSQLRQQLEQAQSELRAAQQKVAIDRNIADNIRPVVEEGAIARVQLLRQEQEVLTGQADVDRLSEERERIQYAINQAQARYQNAVALTSNDLLDRVAVNDKRISELDSQLNKAVVENDKQISEIESQLSQANVTLGYQELRAPTDGVVFDLQARGPGFVANTTEPILKIVPSDSLVARVFVTNKDIGFLREGMDVDVRIDSFPFSEFGDIKGELIWVGSDALPPTQEMPFYTFPAKVRLDSQSLDVNGRDVSLQSGMSISTNILVRKRSVMSIFTDLFSRKVESLKTTR